MFDSSSSGGDGGGGEEMGIVADDVIDATIVSLAESPSVLVVVDGGAGAVGLATGHVFPSSSSAK